MILSLVHLTTRIAKQSNPILDLGHLTTRIAKHRNPISLLDVAVLTTNCKLATADLSVQLPNDRINFLLWTNI